MAHELTPRQQRFVDEYLLDLNATQAAARAGYSKRTAKAQGSRLLTNVAIQAAVSEAQQNRAERTELSQDWIIASLMENVDRAMQAKQVYDSHGKPTGEYVYQGAVANGALQLLGKHLGMFSDNLNLRTPDGPLEIAVTRQVVPVAALKNRIVAQLGSVSHTNGKNGHGRP